MAVYRVLHENANENSIDLYYRCRPMEFGEHKQNLGELLLTTMLTLIVNFLDDLFLHEIRTTET
jgi:hypothetical protein